MRLLFDMDGPLTKSRQRIQDEVLASLEYANNAGWQLHLVTGAKRADAREQLGERGWNVFTSISTCAAQEAQEYMELPDDVRTLMVGTGDQWYSDQRPGSVNIRRIPYYDNDPAVREHEARLLALSADRERLAAQIGAYTGCYATLGGQISLDIYPRYFGKQDVLSKLGVVDYFFCDSLGRLGGDTILADEVIRGGGTVIYTPDPEATVTAMNMVLK